MAKKARILQDEMVKFMKSLDTKKKTINSLAIKEDKKATLSKAKKFTDKVNKSLRSVK